MASNSSKSFVDGLIVPYTRKCLGQFDHLMNERTTVPFASFRPPPAFALFPFTTLFDGRYCSLVMPLEASSVYLAHSLLCVRALAQGQDLTADG